jgi:hypothetical protein
VFKILKNLLQKNTILQVLVIICDDLRRGSMLNSGNNDREQNWLLLSPRVINLSFLLFSYFAESRPNIYSSDSDSDSDDAGRTKRLMKAKKIVESDEEVNSNFFCLCLLSNYKITLPVDFIFVLSVTFLK